MCKIKKTILGGGLGRGVIKMSRLLRSAIVPSIIWESTVVYNFKNNMSFLVIVNVILKTHSYPRYRLLENSFLFCVLIFFSEPATGNLVQFSAQVLFKSRRHSDSYLNMSFQRRRNRVRCPFFKEYLIRHWVAILQLFRTGNVGT